MAYWICAACGVNNREQDDRCEECGRAAAPRGKAEPEAPSRACDCGGMLDARGWCDRASGFTHLARCPYVCPLCRQPLTWEGGCGRCHGCTTGRREDWAFPGDRYEVTDGHYRKVCGPRQACSPAENILGLADCVAALGDAPMLDARRNMAPLPSATDTWFEQFAPWASKPKRGRGRGE